METRNVTLTLEKAKEFYNSGNTALKEVALQAFTVEELEILKFTDIKTFEDAVKALGLCIYDAEIDLEEFDDHRFEGNTSEHLKAIYKLDIIRKALNGDWKPSLIEGSIYYPFVRFYPINKETKKIAADNDWRLGPSFMADGEKYTLVGGGYYCCPHAGMANFGCGYGDILSYPGLLSCKSKEIAEHMSRYFAKEIFEACYAQHTGAYKWIN